MRACVSWSTNSTGLLDSPCHLDIINTSLSFSYAYITILILLYLRFSKRRNVSERCRRFIGHSVRAPLSLLLLLIHLVELSAALVGRRGRLVACSALLAWLPTQLLLVSAEARCQPLYLIVTVCFWSVCGFARAASFLSAFHPSLSSAATSLGELHVTPLSAFAASTLCYALAVCDIFSIVCELNRLKHSASNAESEAEWVANESYQHVRASWYSRVTFQWLTPLLKTGYLRPLELTDLGTLPAEEATATQYQQFNSVYQQNKLSGAVSLWKCYAQCYWTNFVLGGLIKLLGDCIGLIPPLAISVVIDYISAQSNEFDVTPSDVGDDAGAVTVAGLLQNGYVMAGVVLLSIVAQGTLSQASTHLLNVDGIRLKAALQVLVYSKALKLRSIIKEDEFTVESKYGNLTNLMSEDTFNIMTCYWVGHYVWAIPLKIAILMYLLYCMLGVSALVGATCCILVLTPLQFMIGRKMSTNSKEISELSDERLRQTNEVLQGVRLLKLFGWENDFAERIRRTRAKELRALDKDSVYWALLTFLTQASTVLITLVTLIMSYLLEGSQPSAARVFPALALFNQLTVPLFIFPITVPIVISALVSTKRLQDFLDQPEVLNFTQRNGLKQKEAAGKPDNKPIQKRQIAAGIGSGLGDITELEEPDGDGDCDDLDHVTHSSDTAVSVESAQFCWPTNTGSHHTLHISKLHIPAGQLTVIVGPTSSGKTTLLRALLGELSCVRGAVIWTKVCSVAYVSQKPWLINSSLRDNVLFGLPLNQRRYSRVIDSTALQPDIDILPNKDMTDIGERGINLSGGQRHRVAIARALYSKANTVIMDDPLSSLDNHLAHHIFEEGIKRLFKKEKRTVILVTHNVKLTENAHQVLLMEGGCVKEFRPPLAADVPLTGLSHSVPPEEHRRGRTARERWQLVKLVSRIALQRQRRNLDTSPSSWQADLIAWGKPLHVSVSGIPVFTRAAPEQRVGGPKPVVKWAPSVECTSQPPSLFVPFRRPLSKFSGSRYLTHDLLLPTDECEAEEIVERRRVLSALRRRQAARTTSLQTPPHTTPLCLVKRQISSPTINNSSRSRNYAVETDAGEYHDSGAIVSGSGLLSQLFSTSSQRTSGKDEFERLPLHRESSVASDCSDYFYEDEFSNDHTWSSPSCEQECSGDGSGGGGGEVERRIYWWYLRACGVVFGAVYLAAVVSWQAMRVVTDYWLTEWTDHNEEQGSYYLGVYGLLSTASILFSLVANGMGQFCGARARQRLHQALLSHLLLCPLSFFESTPLGTIMNRFSTDFGIIDKKIATSLQRLLQFLLLCFSAVLVNCTVTPWFITLAVPLCLIYYIVQKFYRSSTRELQRLDSTSRNPILSHFAESLSGVETIRAFGQQARFTQALLHKLDCHTNVFLITNSCNRWLGIILDYLGGLIVFVAVLVSLLATALFPRLVSPALVGLAINYTLLLPIYLNWVVKFLADMEMYLGAVERVTQYSRIPSEDYNFNGLLPHLWPKNGDIRFKNVTIQYEPNRELVIRNLNLHIPAGQKVGICGRSGSGKSSLAMSLFRMAPLYEGTIFIDDTDISTIPLQEMRSRLSVIPQDVIMFSGTIRQNLDFRGQFRDEELWQCLEVAQMKESVATELGGLEGPVLEGGSNLSGGQRQLLCLARAALHVGHAPLLVMDEATGALDPATELHLLHTAHTASAFTHTTVITIAHRLKGLLSCNRIIVLDGGRIVEDGTPMELRAQKMGIFSSMLRSGPGSGEEID